MTECPYHLNNFKHLDVTLDGAEQGFDLGYKFERRDARTPFWVLYVSYDSTGLGLGLVARGTLTFADSLAGAGRSSEVEQAALLARAKPSIAQALRTLKTGQPLQTSSDNPQYV